ncbi:MAG: hypothetical protein RL323_1596, partial [Pseudomonadota bacterium]
AEKLLAFLVQQAAQETPSPGA